HCTSPPVCENGGYVNVTCKCTCPAGFTGITCQTVVTDTDCGGYVYLKENDLVLEPNKDVTVTSPNYPGPIGQGKICRWAVKAPEGYIIKMTIDDLHMAFNPRTVRCYHWLEIQYNLPGQPGVRRCGDVVGETFLTSVDSPTLMIVTMDTKFAGSRATHKGFKLHFEKEREVCRDNTCQFGVCIPSALKSCLYKCVCQPGYKGDNCEQVIDGAQLKCTFERFEKCFFGNIEKEDNFQWGIGFKHSISTRTGPEDAYRGLRFLFAEMSLPRKPGDKAVIRTAVPLP
ncbi:blastula protease 10-like, partial [Saccostrea cucullata]|uniref:blastula protease 10-like n=1 Tax=Saccostrea cuccullata TaxID=36930 RepID=UPI002ED12ED1